MHQGDFDGFRALMERAGKLYGKKLDDDMIQGYWRALKDQTLTTVTERVESHIRYQKFFPKPIEMRPKEEKQPQTPDGKFEEGEERAMRRLEDKRRNDPQGWIEEISRAKSGCRALDYAEQFGIGNIWFDFAQRCWRHAQ